MGADSELGSVLCREEDTGISVLPSWLGRTASSLEVNVINDTWLSGLARERISMFQLLRVEMHSPARAYDYGLTWRVGHCDQLT